MILLYNNILKTHSVILSITPTSPFIIKRFAHIDKIINAVSKTIKEPIQEAAAALTNNVGNVTQETQTTTSTTSTMSNPLTSTTSPNISPVKTNTTLTTSQWFLDSIITATKTRLNLDTVKKPPFMNQVSPIIQSKNLYKETPYSILHENHPYILQNKLGIKTIMDLLSKIELNEKQVLEYYFTTANNDSNVFSHTFHISMQLLHNKRIFSIRNVEPHLGKRFSIYDLTQDGTNLVNGSTLYSVLQIEHMLKLYPNFSKLDNILVTQPPIGNFNFSDLSPDIKKLFTNSDTLTGNTFCDHFFNGHPYDSKDILTPTVGKNHVIFVSYDELTQTTKLSTYFNNLEGYFIQETNDPEQNVFVREHYKFLLNKLELLLRDTSITPIQKLNIWNEIAINSFNNRPPLTKFSLLIPSSTETFNPTPEVKLQLDSIHLPIKKRYNDVDVKIAIQKQIPGIDPERMEYIRKAHGIKSAYENMQELYNS